MYKEQYEGLLEEYNQYLADLEALQEKADSLEDLKSTFETEIRELKV